MAFWIYNGCWDHGAGSSSEVKKTGQIIGYETAGAEVCHMGTINLFDHPYLY